MIPAYPIQHQRLQCREVQHPRCEDVRQSESHIQSKLVTFPVKGFESLISPIDRDAGMDKSKSIKMIHTKKGGGLRKGTVQERLQRKVCGCNKFFEHSRASFATSIFFFLVPRELRLKSSKLVYDQRFANLKVSLVILTKFGETDLLFTSITLRFIVLVSSSGQRTLSLQYLSMNAKYIQQKRRCQFPNHRS